jgi:diaminopimelate decarboxylase
MGQAWEIDGFLKTRNGQLYIDGVSTLELAEKYDTPLFVFSESRIRHNIDRLKKAESLIDCPLKICYAAKANSNMAILRAVRDAGSDVEVNSGGELWKALKIGFSPDQIIFNGTSKTESELEDAIHAGIYAIQSDSVYELELTEKAARKLNKRANVSLRLVPEIESETLHGLQTALLTSKFGMMPDEALAAFRRWHDSEFLNLCGIHLHIGSQNPSPETYIEAFQSLFENLLQIFNETGHRLSHLNLGGGFPVNYLRDDAQADSMPEAQQEMFAASFEPAGAIGNAWRAVKESAEKANATHLLENITLLLEPGRSVIADTGICLTTVRNHKERPLSASPANSLSAPPAAAGGLTQPSQDHSADGARDAGPGTNLFTTPDPRPATDHWLLTDAGFNILLSMETYKWYYHLISASRAGKPHETPYKLAGPLCDGGDVYFDIEGLNRLPDHRLLPEGVQPGEILALLNCGAYSIAQMSQYNGRAFPAIVLVRENGEPVLVRKRDTFENLITNDIC